LEPKTFLLLGAMLFCVFYWLTFEFFLTYYATEVISFAFVSNFEFGSVFV